MYNMCILEKLLVQCTPERVHQETIRACGGVSYTDSSKHCHFCIAKIGRAILALFLIPLVKMILLVVQTKLSDRFLIGSKLEEL